MLDISNQLIAHTRPQILSNDYGTNQFDGTEFFNPFFTGEAELRQQGADVVLFVADRASGPNLGVIARFQNTTLASFTSANFGIDFALSTHATTTGNDSITGTTGNDRIRAQGGVDNLNGGDGDDLLDGGAGNDTLTGGIGFDVLLGREGDDTLNGGDGDDVLQGHAGHNVMNGGAGNDQIISHGTQDQIDAGGGNDRIWALEFGQSILAGTGDDRLWLVSSVTGANVDMGDGADYVWFKASGEATSTLALGAGRDELVLELYNSQRQVTLSLGADQDIVRWSDAFLTNRVTISDFATGNAGDVFAMAQFGGADPFAEGVLELRQVGADVQLVRLKLSFGDPVLVVFQNTQLANFTAHNFGGFSPFAPPRVLGVVLTADTTIAAGSTQTTVNPRDPFYDRWGNPYRIETDETNPITVTNNAHIITSNTEPGPLSQINGFSERTGGSGSVLRNAATGVIEVNGFAIETNGLLLNGSIAAINDGRISVTWDGEHPDWVRGVYYGGFYGTPAAFTNNGELTVVSSIDAYGVEISSQGAVINHGDIRVEAGEWAVGIIAETGWRDTPIENHGTITVIPGLDSPFYSVGILIEALGLHAATIVNSGLIDAEIGIYVYFESTLAIANQTLQNSGEITGTVFLNAGADSVFNTGQMAARTLLGSGNDLYDGRTGFHSGSIEGGRGDDQLLGGTGREYLFGDNGNDTINAGAGNDYVEGGPGIDVLDGGTGTDMLSFVDAVSIVEVDLAAGTVVAEGNSESAINFEQVIGSTLADRIHGTSGGNLLYGNAGADLIDGRGGADSLVGGRGADTLTGGAGTDLFLFDAGDGHDIVTDFAAGEALDIYGYAGYQSLQQEGAHLRVVLSASDSILLHNTTAAQLTADSLHFTATPAGFAIARVPTEPRAVEQDWRVAAGAVITVTDPLTIERNAFRGPGADPNSAFVYFKPQWIGGLGLWNEGTIQLSTTLAGGRSEGNSQAEDHGGNNMFVNLAGAQLLVSAAAAETAVGSYAVGAVFNHGLIAVSNAGGAAIGAELHGEMTTRPLNGSFLNTGTITVTASGAATGIVPTYQERAIFNSGTIIVTGGAASSGIRTDTRDTGPDTQPGIVNSGSIIVADSTAAADSAGLRIDTSQRTAVWNSGTIRADFAILWTANTHQSWNDAGFDIWNSGLLDGGVRATSYADLLVNTGEIRGVVELGSGDDLFDGRAGQHIGLVDGGDGNDTLLGGAGAQTLLGGFGADVLSGGAGADLLTGGEGADQFHFASGSGQDIISDLGVGGADRIRVQGYTAWQVVNDGELLA